MKKTYLNSFCARCLTLLVLALLSTNLAWGAEETIDVISKLGLKENKTNFNLKVNDYITVSATQGGAGTPTTLNYNSTKGVDLRLYKHTTGNAPTFTIAATNATISKVEFKKNSTTTSSLSSFSANVGTLTNNVWEGNANSVTFTYDNSTTNFKEQIYIINVTYTYEEGKTLESIAISGTPTKNTYEAGEEFDPAGLVVTGTYSEGDPEVITSGITWNSTPNPLTAGTTSVSVTAKVGEITSDAYVVNGLTVKAIEGDRITLSETGITPNTTSYANWENSYTATSGAVYTGNNAGGNSAIQLRSDASKPASGIVSTTSGGYIKKVKVVWESHTAADRELEVFGSNTAYTAVADLVDNDKKGTSLGTIKYGTSTELIIDGKYAYVGVRSKSGAMYLSSITFVWGAPRTYDVQITAAKYATLGLPYAVTIPDGVSAYTATVEGTTVTMTKISGGVIPANCGVILYAETPKTYTFTETADVDLALDNQLVAVIGETYICGDDHGKDYYLGLSNGQATFKKLNVGGTIAAGKAYLKLENALDANAKLEVTFGEPTGIKSLTPALSEGKGVYNLNGMRVNPSTGSGQAYKAYKGIVIMNGKKYINK